MPIVFVSHASDDELFVERFVSEILQLGCGLQSDEVFYSSGADTGVPLGANLNSYVRDKVGEADLVVAIISPSYQTRQFCVAELGAAWIRTGALFPLLTPGMTYSEMDGVLASLLVGFINERKRLNRLHDQVSATLGRQTSTATWSRHCEKWLANVDEYAKDLPVPHIVDRAEFRELQTQLDGARDALRESEKDRRALEGINARLLAARTADEAREAVLPENEVTRFQMLLGEVNEAFRKLDDIVQEAIWYNARSQRMPMPRYHQDQERHGAAIDAINNGLLIEAFDEELDANTEFPDIAAACRAVKKLFGFFGEPSPEFDEWFRSEYNAPPRLDYRRVWNDVLGS